MVKFTCCSLRDWRKKRDEGEKGPSEKSYEKSGKQPTQQVKLKKPVKLFESRGLKFSTFGVSKSFPAERERTGNVKVRPEDPVEEPEEVQYKGEDESEENSMKKNISDCKIKACEAQEEPFNPRKQAMDSTFSIKPQTTEAFEKAAGKGGESGVDRIEDGHVSDPGAGKAEFWASPKLKRSCSNMETRDVLSKMGNKVTPSKSLSFEKLQKLSAQGWGDFDPVSPCSVMSLRSADQVILKKRSSSQILPSRSRRLWWRLFLWSHRNLHRSLSAKSQPPIIRTATKMQGGYCSDTVEMKVPKGIDNMESPGSFTGESMNICCNHEITEVNPKWDLHNGGVSGFLPQNQWVAFSLESPSLSRVDEWVKDLHIQPQDQVNDEEKEAKISFPPSPQAGRSPDGEIDQLAQPFNANVPDEALNDNNVIQSLNSSSTVAHISGIGLDAIPAISKFSSLRSVNLSGNVIAHIAPGSLPKTLHTLNLSRNKISTIEGLREQTRLRVLDLSYNRISRIGHGLSSCTMIKELYLAGNKISEVEGLHRLLKLTVLDLSFNKIATAKALGQLVANYKSLLALNLLGNPIQSHVSDPNLRKAVSSLLPSLVYLNKQPIKAERALTDNVAKAALGNDDGKSARKKATKKLSRAASSSSAGAKRSAAGKKRNRAHRHLTLKTAASAPALWSH